MTDERKSVTNASVATRRTHMASERLASMPSQARASVWSFLRNVPHRRKFPKRRKYLVRTRGLTRSSEKALEALKVLAEQIEAKTAGLAVSGEVKHRRELPDAMPDGSDVTNLDDLAVVMGVNRLVAPLFVLQSKDASPELTEQARTELKAIRRVRTREGEHVYGQPIGSVIVPNAVPNVRDAVGAPRTLKASEKWKPVIKKKDHNTVEGWHNGKKLHTAHREQYGSFKVEQHVPDTLDMQPNRYRPEMPDSPQHGSAFDHIDQLTRFWTRSLPTVSWKKNHEGLTYWRHHNGSAMAGFTDDEGKKHRYEVRHDEHGGAQVYYHKVKPETRADLEGQSIGHINEGSPANMQKKASAIIHADIEKITAGYNADNPRTPNPGNFQDLYTGIEGQQWTDGSKEDDGEWDREKRKQRLLQRMEEKDLFLVGDVNLESAEVVNSICDTYEEMYPGFTRINRVWQGHYFAPNPKTGGTTLADNASMPNGTEYGKGEEHEDVDVTAIQHGVGWIRMNTTYFGKDAMSGGIARVVEQMGEKEWFSVQMPRLRKQYPEMDDSQIATLAILNHEIGHTVVSIATTFDYPATEKTAKGRKARQHIRDAFFTDIANIVEEWQLGQVISHKAPDDYPDKEFGDKVMAEYALRAETLDKPNTKKYLSQYGGEKLHELCAGSRAEYMMDSEPRTLATAIGNHMHSFIEDYMDELDDWEKS